MVGRPVARAPKRAFSRAFASNVAPVSSTSPSTPRSSSVTSSARSTARRSRSSAELVGRAGRDRGAGAETRPRSALHRREDLGLGGEQALEAGRREVHQALHRRPVERLALGRPLDLDERPGIRADDVEVDVGAGVLAVVEVEERLAVDEPDADRRRSGRRDGDPCRT